MALILRKLFQGYFWLFNEYSDPRALDFPLMGSVLQPTLIMMLYLYFTYNLGPKIMNNRKAFELKEVIIGFNLAQVLVNAYLVIQGTILILGSTWYCSTIDYSPENKTSAFHLKLAYIYFLTKLADLLDTVFFILRKRSRQVSFLHVYHHFGMTGLSWVITKFIGGGHSFYLITINCFVHAVMYSYYLLSVWDEKYKTNVWWKKYITQLQLFQFLMFILLYGGLLFQPTCGYPKQTSFFMVPQNLFMISLFGDFYIKTYIKKKPQKKVESEEKCETNTKTVRTKG